MRIVFTPFTFYDADYKQYRIPVATGLLDGKGLYSEIAYNQMPVYPYISAFMLFLVGTSNSTLTRMAIKFPQVLADACIPFVLYKISLEISSQQQNNENIKRSGVLASVVYALNPMGLYELSNATFHFIASLFLLLAVYCLLKNKPILVGFLISLGFLVSQYPLFVWGIVFIYWRNDVGKIIRSGFSFLFITIAILGATLIPYNTSIQQMVENLNSHNSYQARVLNATQVIVKVIELGIELPNNVWSTIWLIVFTLCMLLPLYLYFRNPLPTHIIAVITMQVTLLSIFFISNHSKHTIWLLPWILLWSFTKRDIRIYIPLLIFLGYFLRRLRTFLPGEFLFGSIVLGFSGIWILAKIIRELKNSNTVTSPLHNN
ncbi:MAG: glycosyltransferase 87 family protein [Candidatus Kariarchaeaceae archaeon]